MERTFVPRGGRLAVLFRRVGPYHLARLRAARAAGDVWCVEGSGADALYAWDTVETGNAFHRVTLFPAADSGDMPPRAVRRAVFKALDQIHPPVIAIPGWEDRLALAALQWSIKARKPVVVMSDTHELGGSRAGLKEWIKRRLVNLCAAGLVAGAAAADYLTKLGMSRERIFTGYDVVDNEYFASKTAEVRSQSSVVRGQFGLPERCFVCPARFIREKNLPRLLEAYARYRALASGSVNQCFGASIDGAPQASANRRTETPKHRNTAPWDLVLLGDGPLRPSLHSQLSTLNLHGHVHLPGFKQYDELPEYYGLASAVVLPSVSETWGLAVNEAMASALPVLVSNRCGCAPDLVREGVNGFTFDPLDVEELANRMLRLTETPKHRLTEMGDASRQIIGYWSPELFAENLWRAAETAMARPKRTATTLDWMLFWALGQRQ